MQWERRRIDAHQMPERAAEVVDPRDLPARIIPDMRETGLPAQAASPRRTRRPRFDGLRQTTVRDALKDLQRRVELLQLVFLYPDAGWTHGETR